MKFGRETGDRLLARFLRRLKRRIVGQRRIAADAEVVLHAALGRQAVVVPSHRIEHGLAAHALKARDDVGVGVGEDVSDVERAADGRRRRVDRVDVAPGAAAIEAIHAGLVPAAHPLRLEPLERGFFRHANRMVQIQATRHNRQRISALLDSLYLLAHEAFGDVEDGGTRRVGQANEDTRRDLLDQVVGDLQRFRRGGRGR